MCVPQEMLKAQPDVSRKELHGRTPYDMLCMELTVAADTRRALQALKPLVQDFGPGLTCHCTYKKDMEYLQNMLRCVQVMIPTASKQSHVLKELGAMHWSFSFL